VPSSLPPLSTERLSLVSQPLLIGNPPLSLSSFVQHLFSPAPSVPPLSVLAARLAGAHHSPLAANHLALASSLLSKSAGAPVLNVDAAGQPLTFCSALAGPFRSQWVTSDDDELVKLVKNTGTLTPVHTYTSTPTYYKNRVVKEKWTPSALLRPGPSRSLTDDVSRRVRGTAGGDRLPSSCPPSTDVASLTADNIALNSVVSDNAAFFGTADLTDLYLGTPVTLPLSQRQFIKIDSSLSPPIHPPVYGSSAPQRATTDSSPPTTAAQKKELEIAIGYLLYYG
jgi:hypothetical protein